MPDALDRNLIADCARHLGLTLSELRSIAATAPKRYYVWKIAKRSGGKRTVCHPAAELKLIQEYFLDHVLHVLPVHASATAYKKGSSIKKNAQAHAAGRAIFKLDFKDFFNKITIENWKLFAARNFPEWTSDELDFSGRILFWGVDSYTPKCLAIGAPTSPLISNAIMFEVDDILSKHAAKTGMVYTRYADDIVFSSQGKIDEKQTLRAIKGAIAGARFSRMMINRKKTALISNRFALRVTGLVITPEHKVSLGRDRKRLIRAMTHRKHRNQLDQDDLSTLRGLLAFAQDIEPSFVLSLRDKFGTQFIDQILSSVED